MNFSGMVDHKPRKRKEKKYLEFGGTLAFNHPKIKDTLHYTTAVSHSLATKFSRMFRCTAYL